MTALTADEAAEIREEIDAALLDISQRHHVAPSTVIKIAELPVAAPVRGYGPIPGRSTVEAICRHVAEATEVAVKDLTGANRSPAAIRARWIAMRALRDRCMPVVSIGKALGRDHTTVIHGLRRFDEIAAEDPRYAALAREAAQIGVRQ
jgi:chromosomal replication initiation ATPase DnaA